MQPSGKLLEAFDWIRADASMMQTWNPFFICLFFAFLYSECIVASVENNTNGKEWFISKDP